MHTQRLGSLHALLALCLFLLSLSSASFAGLTQPTETLQQPSTSSMHCQGCPHPAAAELDCCLHMQSCSSCISVTKQLQLVAVTAQSSAGAELQQKILSLYYPPHTPPPKQLL